MSRFSMKNWGGNVATVVSSANYGDGCIFSQLWRVATNDGSRRDASEMKKSASVTVIAQRWRPYSPCRILATSAAVIWNAVAPNRLVT